MGANQLNQSPSNSKRVRMVRVHPLKKHTAKSWILQNYCCVGGLLFFGRFHPPPHLTLFESSTDPLHKFQISKCASPDQNGYEAFVDIAEIVPKSTPGWVSFISSNQVRNLFRVFPAPCRAQKPEHGDTRNDHRFPNTTKGPFQAGPGENKISNQFLNDNS